MSSHLQLLIQRMTSKTSLSTSLAQSLQQQPKEAKKRNNNATNRQQKDTRDNTSLSLIVTFSKTNKTLLKGFVVFSKTHDSFNLRRDSLFLAFEIYARIYNKSELNDISISYLQCISLYLAMKYEEIYHPLLRNLQKELGIYVDLAIYKKYEVRVLRVLESNLNLPLVCRQMDQEMGQANQIQNMLALYLLEICMATTQIYLKYPRQQVIKGVTILAKRKQTQMLNGELNTLCKLMLLAKTNILKIQPSIYYKYQQSKYESVSMLPI